MRVIEVIIDGFKSYAVRTVISGWDESFNSITGLNGSGKSNILDSICFVLGITNMSTVRAQNLQDLIYKRGQAGVTKASVTIVFDNKDKTKSPIGFEEYAQISVSRQIVLGGTSKYLINGHRAQQQTVQNLFQSVQLNINNPNFLIMQGRITKVLNMKAVEILAMIEEAAGTRMFEDRRDKAFKTMAKKQMKLEEIQELLRDEIEPKLERLRQEKRAFLDFQQVQSDVERLARLVVAYDHIKATQRLKQSTKEVETHQNRAKELESSAVRLKSEIGLLQDDVAKVNAAKDKELRKGGRFQSLEEEVKQHSHETVRLATVMDLKKASHSEELAKQTALQKSEAELETQLSQKQQHHQGLQEEYKRAREEVEKHSAQLEKEEELLQTLQTGVASKDGQETGYQGQLQDARNRASAAQTEQEQAKLKITHLEAQLKEDEPRAKQAKQQNSSLEKEVQKLRGEGSALEGKISKFNIQPEREAELHSQETGHQSKIRELRVQIDGLKKKVANIDFQYSDPSPNFDRSKVKGVVARLFTLDKQYNTASTALEICAGGRLYNVVVDTAETGTQLLQKGKLKKRVTIIPLNQISAFQASAEKIAAAKNLAPGRVDLALSLIGYDDEVNAAMAYVFGSTFVCQDADAAKRVTFDAAVRSKSVTLSGDVYDPSGTLSGGSSPNSAGVLLILQQLNLLSRELDQNVHELARVQATLAQENSKFATARQLKQDLELKQHEIRLAEEQIASNSSSSILQKIEDCKNQLVELRAQIKEAQGRYKAACDDEKRISRDINEFSQDKDTKLRDLQKTVAQLKRTHAQYSGAIKPLQQQMREASLEAEQCSQDLQAAQEQLREVTSTIEVLAQELGDLSDQHTQVSQAYEVAQAALDDERSRLCGFDDELQALETAASAKQKKLTEEGLEQQQLVHRMEKAQKERDGCAQSLSALEKEHDWIADEQDAFGQANTPYDFSQHNMPECRATLKTASERFQGMKKKVNPKVMNMIDSVEKKEGALKNMMRTVLRDKHKIEETIASLDEYKKDALERTWTKVNGDFGQIFNELLPGSFAKLDPPEGKTINDGLEVRVCLGKVWKQSLTELSGGQRSLIALSLIMALLQFKPAPMYILDEVDAALDLSHTQNIGRLIKTRFKGSQFIVVSLKDGMFQNANRIFRTRFSDGTSVVQALTPADLK